MAIKRLLRKLSSIFVAEAQPYEPAESDDYDTGQQQYEPAADAEEEEDE